MTVDVEGLVVVKVTVDVGVLVVVIGFVVFIIGGFDVVSGSDVVKASVVGGDKVEENVVLSE